MSSLFSHVRMPIGVPACPLTRDRMSIEGLFKAGYNIITTKTVRSSYFAGNPKPLLAFITDPDRPNLPSDTVTPETASLVNSLGMPSSTMETWKLEFKSVKYEPHQQLIVSVVGGGPNFVSDFVDVATMAAEVSNYVELNFSCPNEIREGARPEIFAQAPLVYHDPTLVNWLLQHVRVALPSVKLLVKVGYMPRTDVPMFIDAIEDLADGITAINTMPRAMFKADNITPYFPGRSKAGVSGALIKEQARETIAALMCYKRPETALIAVGGVSSPEDGGYYLRVMGVDAVQMATSVMLQGRISRDLLDSPKVEEGLSKDG